MLNHWQTFKEYCLTRGVRQTSIATYEVYIYPFLALSPVVDNQMALFCYLNERYDNAYTRKKCWEHIRIFFKWALRNGHMVQWWDGFRILAPLPEPPPVLTREELMKIISAIPATRRGLRDRALLALYFSTGARRCSILNLRKDDLDLDARWMYFRVMKGGKRTSKPIPQAAADYLAAWLKRAPESPWIFPSLRLPDRHLDKSAITHYLKQYAKLAGFPDSRRIYTHLLRHSFATELARQGQPAEVIMQCLDHSDIRMSLNYIRRSPYKVREVTDQVFGTI